jgi:hypothetical protein
MCRPLAVRAEAALGGRKSSPRSGGALPVRAGQFTYNGPSEVLQVAVKIEALLKKR